MDWDGGHYLASRRSWVQSLLVLKKKKKLYVSLLLMKTEQKEFMQNIEIFTSMKLIFPEFW
jgi:hypothetical protein